ncbi:non-heme iron oxygenase ferredoxin subunit [Novosphingobium album (ex Liu et al. 2023)]|uniref:Non-heme iron oxygenase ferredoxin subunit n=1 Tax=Novosphingobium album (ex Liu et al. 2023) TaxID=3031130 RepID=A0ABT5WPQ1_9SPHN|nr:non-heme iron oxygenase ferredoxin subunit [Novosphingobium album (ex Liu et al. 2023)]MDE8652005.1 non-heme iron oxygenase ferredoxin subunit [Novosphingobium album (ex Liu et al. 2023)]
MDTQESYPGVTIRLCATSDIPEGEVLRVDLDDGRALAVYHWEGQFFATDDLCTHGDASLSEGEIEDGRILCPFHMGSFDIRTGEAVAAPCSIAVRTYPLTTREGEVFLVD